jgi:hypothetical protein
MNASCETLTVIGSGFIGLSIPLFYSKEIFYHCAKNLAGQGWTKTECYIMAAVGLAMICVFSTLAGLLVGKALVNLGRRCCPGLC